MKNNTASSFVEGQSTARPPLFNGLNYSHWSTGMRICMQANGYDTWNITQQEYFAPTTP